MGSRTPLGEGAENSGMEEEAQSGNEGGDLYLKLEEGTMRSPEEEPECAPETIYSAVCARAPPLPLHHRGVGEDVGGLDGDLCSEGGVAPDGRDSNMDSRSWLWSRKPSEKSSGEMEGPRSILSSPSEKHPKDLEVQKSSQNDGQPPDVSSNDLALEDRDIERALREKLASALSNIRAKEDVVKQHIKVAEEAISGWEKAENEVANLKQKLENSLQKNASLEHNVSQLDGALKECVRQLRLAREEQEQKIHDALLSKVCEWETEKFELESKLVELESQLESAKADVSESMNVELMQQFEGLKKENAELKVELYVLHERFRIVTVENELSNQAAEAASKQHLESIKKVAKLEAECRRLRIATRKSQSNEYKSLSNTCVESLTDSHSDSGERMLFLDNEPSCSDSWASALVAELEQFKNSKCAKKDMLPSATEIDLMDDFLEMERLAALSVSNDIHTSPSVDVGSTSGHTILESDMLKTELEQMVQRITEVEEKLGLMETEKADILNLLDKAQEKLKVSSKQMEEDEIKLLELQRQLDSLRASKQVSDIAIEAADARRKVLEAQLNLADTEIHNLREKMGSLERELGKEKSSADKLAVEYRNLQVELDRINLNTDPLRVLNSIGELKVKQERDLASAAGKLSECQQTITSLRLQLTCLATMDDFTLDNGKMEMGNGLSTHSDETKKSHLIDSLEVTALTVGPSNGKGRWSPSPPSSLPLVGFLSSLPQVSSS